MLGVRGYDVRPECKKLLAYIKTSEKISSMATSRTRDPRQGKKKTAAQKPQKRAKTGKLKVPAKKQPPQLSQEAIKNDRPISPRTGKPLQKQLGKTKAQVKLRAKKIAAGLIMGMTGGEAVRAAGYSMSGKANPGTILSNPLIKQTYCEILDAAGATDEACAKVIVDGMRAMRAVSCISGKDAGSGSVDFVDVEDHPVRLKAVDMVHKVRGRYVDKKIITGPDGGPVRVKAVELTDEELFAIASRGRPGVNKAAKSPRKPA
jgi:hypothetical protein